MDHFDIEEKGKKPVLVRSHANISRNLEKGVYGTSKFYFSSERSDGPQLVIPKNTN